MKKTIPIFLLACSFCFANPFAKPSEAHGILKLNQTHPSKDIFPVSVYEIDGKQVLKRNNGVWLKPGKHTLKVSAVINKDQLTKSIVKTQKGYNRNRNLLDITVEPGNIYYVGYDASDRNPNNWQAVVWKVKSR